MNYQYKLHLPQHHYGIAVIRCISGIRIISNRYQQIIIGILYGEERTSQDENNLTQFILHYPVVRHCVPFPVRL